MTTTMPTEEVEVIEMTPAAAIRHSIHELIRERHDWKERDDPNGVRPWIDARIANLDQALHDLAEYEKIKKALAVLKAIA